jgi:hypothetical protein
VTDQPLVIPVPPNSTVQVEVDLRDDDLLGVFKSLLRGVGQAANSGPTAAGLTSTAKPTSDAQIAAILSNVDLSDVLKDVTHVHFVMFQLPGGAAPALVPAPDGAKVKPAVATNAPPALPDQTAFYETAFATEGGHRIIYANNDPIHLLMTSFGHAHGFAFVVQAPGGLAVLRADGYPDLSKLAALATSVGAAFGKAAITGATSKLAK